MRFFQNEEEVGDFQAALFQAHPDFGNYGKKEKRRAVMDLLAKADPENRYSLEGTDATANAILEDLGETSTYGVGEFAMDTIPPEFGAVGGAYVGRKAGEMLARRALGSAVGGALSGPAGMVAGGLLGGGAMTGMGEHLKSEYERAKRGIQTRWEEGTTLQGLAQQGPLVLADIVTRGIGGPFLRGIYNRGKERFGAKVLTPRTGVSQRSQRAQEFLEEVPRDPVGPRSPDLTRARREMQDWMINAQEKAHSHSLFIDELNAEEGNMVSQMGAMLRSGFFTAGQAAEHSITRWRDVQGKVSDMFWSMAEDWGPEEWGRKLTKSLNGEINLLRAANHTLQNRADDMVYATKGTMDMGPFWDHLVREYADRGRIKDFGTVLGRLNQNLGWNVKATTMAQKDEAIMLIDPKEFKAKVATFPREVPFEVADSIWRMLNSYRTDASKDVMDHMVKLIREPYMQSLTALDPYAAKVKKYALDFHGEISDTITKNKVITRDLLKQMVMEDKPGYVVKFLTGGDLATNTRNLRVLKNAYTAGTYKVRPSTLKMKTFEDQVLNPIRYNILSRAYDPQSRAFLGSNLREALVDFGMRLQQHAVKDPKNPLKVRESFVPGEFLSMVFPGPEGQKVLDNWMKAADTLETLQAGLMGQSNIIMKIMQARQIANPEPGGILSLAVAPVALLRIFNNPEATQKVLKGLHAYSYKNLYGPSWGSVYQQGLYTIERMTALAAQEQYNVTGNMANFLKESFPDPEIQPKQSLATGMGRAMGGVH